jgi:hypothetical protein
MLMGGRPRKPHIELRAFYQTFHVWQPTRARSTGEEEMKFI